MYMYIDKLLQNVFFKKSVIFTIHEKKEEKFNKW